VCLTKFFILSVFFTVVLVGVLFVFPVVASDGGAETAVSSAKASLKTCYDAISRAESAGANVESLMVTLNDAAGLMSKAELAYASNNYDSAYQYAKQSQSTLGDLESQANALASDAQAHQKQSQAFTSLSAIAGLGILFAGVFAWAVLGKQQRRLNFGASTV
jgi:hypothetical protein